MFIQILRFVTAWNNFACSKIFHNLHSLYKNKYVISLYFLLYQEK